MQGITRHSDSSKILDSILAEDDELNQAVETEISEDEIKENIKIKQKKVR